MNSAYLSEDLRRRVREAAGNRCGYCRASQGYVYEVLEIEHILPRALGGSNEEANLWLSCGRCNNHKGAQTTGVDSITGQTVPLFNPRTQRWTEHFRWDASGIQVIGLTAIGRATVEALKLNHELALIVRRNWVMVGWHPPSDNL